MEGEESLSVSESTQSQEEGTPGTLTKVYSLRRLTRMCINQGHSSLLMNECTSVHCTDLYVLTVLTVNLKIMCSSSCPRGGTLGGAHPPSQMKTEVCRNERLLWPTRCHTHQPLPQPPLLEERRERQLNRRLTFSTITNKLFIVGIILFLPWYICFNIFGLPRTYVLKICWGIEQAILVMHCLC